MIVVAKNKDRKTRLKIVFWKMMPLSWAIVKWPGHRGQVVCPIGLLAQWTSVIYCRLLDFKATLYKIRPHSIVVAKNKDRKTRLKIVFWKMMPLSWAIVKWPGHERLPKGQASNLLSVLSLCWNPTIFNIILWVAESMGRTTHRPNVWCSKHFIS